MNHERSNLRIGFLQKFIHPIIILFDVTLSLLAFSYAVNDRITP